MPLSFASFRRSWWLLPSFAVLALFTAWQFGKRPDQIPPHIYGSGIDSSSMEPVDVTIYDYSNRDKWITNGRSVTFRIPIAYLTFDAALAGGAQAEISIDFDNETGEPWTREHFAALRTESVKDIPKSADLHTTYHWLRRMSTTVSVFHRPFDERQAKGLWGAKLGNPDWLYKQYVYLGDSICDYDMFENTDVHGTLDLVPPRYPFNKATVFARSRNGKSYDTMVECIWLSGNTWCHATRQFEGLPLTVYFDGNRLCNVDAVFDRAAEMLEGFVVQRTAPVSGWGSTN
jgi:hypothetical protein